MATSSSSLDPPLLNLPPSMSLSPLTSPPPSTPSPYPSPPSRPIYSDRFIPLRSASNFALFGIGDEKSLSSSQSPEEAARAAAYRAALRRALFGESAVEGGRIFRYMTETRREILTPWPKEMESGGGGTVTAGTSSVSPAKTARKIARSPYKVLDAPALQDDFYLNLVDWSSHNVLSVGLGNCVYLWNASSSKVTKLCDLGMDDSVCSVGWAQRGTYLAVGTNEGKVQIWDASRCKRVRTMEGHRLRVGSLAWSSSVLSSGSRDKNILLRDIRAQDDYISKLNGHKSEVCGLKWSYDNRELASGGNDNRLFVWNQNSTQPMLKYCEHTAAVKAIAWSPHVHGLLVSGGGTADRCIRFWSTTTNTYLSCMDTGSQVCNLAWSRNVNELVSTHGYSQNQIIVWKYPTMSKLATLTGHTYRVLYLAISPDGQTIVTGAGDETLRFWNVFPSPKSQNTGSQFGAFSHGRSQIR